MDIVKHRILHLVTNAEVIRLFWPVLIETGEVGRESDVRMVGVARS